MQNPLLFVPRSLNKKRKKDDKKDNRSVASGPTSRPKQPKLTNEVIVIDDNEKEAPSSDMDKREKFPEDPAVVCVIRSGHDQLSKLSSTKDTKRDLKTSHPVRNNSSNSVSVNDKPIVKSSDKQGSQSERPPQFFGIVSVLSAIENQKDPPYRDVGCLSPRKQIAVYRRSCVKSKVKKEDMRVYTNQCEKVYFDVDWDPWYCNKQYGSNSGYSDRYSQMYEYNCKNSHVPEYYSKYSHVPEYYRKYSHEPEYHWEHSYKPEYQTETECYSKYSNTSGYHSKYSHKSDIYHEHSEFSWYSNSYQGHKSQYLTGVKDTSKHFESDPQKFYKDTGNCSVSQGNYFDNFTANALGAYQQRTSYESTKNNQFGELPFGYPREWEYTDFGSSHVNSPPIPGQLDFTVMSYNVLAQNLLEDNSYLYFGSRSYTLDWEYRKSRLLKEFNTYSPDIMCFQEVNVNHYEDFFVPELKKLGYEGNYVQRTGDKIDGCATFYKTSIFTLDKAFPIHYKNPEGGDLLDRDNVALILKLIPKLNGSEQGEGDTQTSKRLFISNTHLLFNPRRGDVKLAQLMMLLAELDKCSYLRKEKGRDSYHGLILCGDFNLQPQSDIYRLLAMGQLEYEGLDRRTLSGQEISHRRSSGPYLVKNFLPMAVGINDNCQYCDVVNDRRDSFINLDKDDDIITNLQGSGLLTHQLQLLSAYTHRVGRFDYNEDEITTHHGRSSCTVDYIFYGVDSAEVAFKHDKVNVRNVKEGMLKLIGRYGLLSAWELDCMGSLPNQKLGSDHLCLIARFLFS